MRHWRGRLTFVGKLSGTCDTLLRRRLAIVQRRCWHHWLLMFHTWRTRPRQLQCALSRRRRHLLLACYMQWRTTLTPGIDSGAVASRRAVHRCWTDWRRLAADRRLAVSQAESQAVKFYRQTRLFGWTYIWRRCLRTRLALAHYERLADAHRRLYLLDAALTHWRRVVHNIIILTLECELRALERREWPTVQLARWWRLFNGILVHRRQQSDTAVMFDRCRLLTTTRRYLNNRRICDKQRVRKFQQISHMRRWRQHLSRRRRLAQWTATWWKLFCRRTQKFNCTADGLIATNSRRFHLTFWRRVASHWRCLNAAVTTNQSLAVQRQSFIAWRQHCRQRLLTIFMQRRWFRQWRQSLIITPEHWDDNGVDNNDDHSDFDDIETKLRHMHLDKAQLDEARQQLDALNKQLSGACDTATKTRLVTQVLSQQQHLHDLEMRHMDNQAVVRALLERLQSMMSTAASTVA